MDASSNSLTATMSASMGPALDFLRLIWAVDHGLQRMSKFMETWLGITGPQRLVIRMVGRHPGIPAGQLAELLHIHPSTLTGILKRLESRGLVARRTDGADARRSLITLTEHGREFDIETDGTIEATIARTLAEVPADKLDAAREILRMIPHAFEATLAQPPPARPTPPLPRPPRKRPGRKPKAR